MYAIAMIPFIPHLTGFVSQVWYADDACADGSRLSDVYQWWN